jgi:hypothetical protein
MDYHPVLDGLKESTLRTDTGAGSATYAIETPGDMARVRMNMHYRARDAKDGYEVQMSFDDGKTFKKVEDYAGPSKASSKYFTCSDVPAGTKKALVKLIARQRNTVCVFDMRIDADYKEPAGGFRPVKVTYVWEENGQEKRDVHVAKQASETYKIKCGTKPLMKSVIMELAD